MNKKFLYALWGGMFIICGGLGFIPEPAGALGAVLTVLSLGFFLPPALLVWGAAREKDRYVLLLVRNLSALSLGLTLALLVLNFISALASEALGSVLYGILVIVSSPMIACGHWALSLFLWACLLMASTKYLRKQET